MISPLDSAFPQVLCSLAQVFGKIRDPRHRRGVRHPVASLLSLVFLGLLARIREMAVLQRWSEEHWEVLREPLGFRTAHPPNATTFSRVLAACSLADFAQAFAEWTQQFIAHDEPLIMALDGKTSCQGMDENGHPIHTLTALIHHLKIAAAQWSIRGEKTNEPGALLNHLHELTSQFPGLRLITGDAIFTQRPLAQALMDANCDYLFQLKNNQPEAQEAAKQAFSQAAERPPAAQTLDKKGASGIGAASGLTWTTPTMFASDWDFPDVASSCALTARSWTPMARC